MRATSTCTASPASSSCCTRHTTATDRRVAVAARRSCARRSASARPSTAPTARSDVLEAMEGPMGPLLPRVRGRDVEGPAVVGLSGGIALDLVYDGDGPRHLVPRE